MSTTHQETIADRVRKIVSEQFAVSSNAPADTRDDADLQRDLKFDSLDIMELTMGVEDEFGLDIEDDAMHGFTTVRSIVDYVTANVKA